MQKREKILVMVTGAVIGLFILQYAARSFFDKLDQRQALRDKLAGDVETQKLQIHAAAVIAAKERTELRKKSLPPVPQIARSLYQDWLLARIKDAGLREPDLKSLPTRVETRRDTSAGRRATPREVYRRYGFTLGCRGTLDELTSLLYAFYRADFLHQVRSLTVTPVKKTRDLDLTITIDAISLPGAPVSDKLSDAVSDRLAHDSIDDYRDAILHRNLFGPENHPPQLAPISSPSVKMGETVRFTAKATDADPLDTVTYRLDDAPQGATIGASDGKVQWKPPASLEPGKYELKVTATDDGMPRRSASTTVTVTIRPPQLRIARLRDQTIKPGDRVRLRVSLDERDPKAKVTFALAGSVPEGATIDRESGEFVWTPTAAQAENDRYEITVAAVDDAQPSRSDRATFRIVLQRPKVVPYVPDVAARHTFVTGILEVDGEPEVWLEVRTTGERPHLRKGDRLVAGNFRAVVAAVRIEPREVDFLRDGQLYTVELGRSLAEAVNAPTGGF